MHNLYTSGPYEQIKEVRPDRGHFSNGKEVKETYTSISNRVSTVRNNYERSGNSMAGEARMKDILKDYADGASRLSSAGMLYAIVVLYDVIGQSFLPCKTLKHTQNYGPESNKKRSRTKDDDSSSIGDSASTTQTNCSSGVSTTYKARKDKQEQKRVKTQKDFSSALNIMGTFDIDSIPNHVQITSSSQQSKRNQ